MANFRKDTQVFGLTRSLGSSTGDIFTVAIRATTNNDDAVGALNWQEHA